MRDGVRRCFSMQTKKNVAAFPAGGAAAATEAPVMGEAFAGVADHMDVNGERYRLVFDNMTFVLIEQVYREQYGRTAGLPQVLAELEMVSYGAVMAVFYAAMMRAAKLDGKLDMIPDWDAFVGAFKLADLPGAAEKLKELRDRALPDPEPDSKNAETPQTARRTKAGRGRG